jgi:hypothetical protein
MIRNRLLKVRLTPEELADIQAKAEAAGITVSDLARRRLLDYRLRQSGPERELLLHLARIGGNINQLARWANTYKGRIETIEIITRLDELQAGIKTLSGDSCS